MIPPLSSSVRYSRGARLGTLLPLTLILILIACGERRGATVGDNDDIVVAAEPSLWKQVQGRVNASLQPRLFGIPNSRAFQVTYQDPAEEEWSGASHNRQVLLIGEPEDTWVADALARARDTPSEIPPAPALFELQDVWAEDQRVMVLLVPSTDPERTVLDRLNELSANYELRYREDVVARMFADGTGQALWDTIMGESGFNVLVPRDYERSKEGDVYLFQKTGTDSLEAVRHVTVTWRTPIPPDMQGDGLLRFRRQLATAHFGSPQTVRLRNVLASQTTHQGNVTYQLLGMWTNPRPSRGGPFRGSFILRAEICQSQDRMYLLDGWLYAPEQDQHEYMVELESILNSFRCGSARPSTATR